MDPFTIALAAFNILDGKDKQRRQGILDKTEAKWSGYKGYQPFEGTANTGLGSTIQQVGWQRALEKAAEKEAQKGKVTEKDETLAAQQFAAPADNKMGPPVSLKGNDDMPEGYDQTLGFEHLGDGDDEMLTDEENSYLKMLQASKKQGGFSW